MLLDAMRQAERREAFREALDLQAELVELLAADDQRWLEVLKAMPAEFEAETLRAPAAPQAGQGPTINGRPLRWPVASEILIF